MNFEEYIKIQISLGKQPNLELIYKDLMNCGYTINEIYDAINKQIIDNINQAIQNYLKKEK